MTSVVLLVVSMIVGVAGMVEVVMTTIEAHPLATMIESVAHMVVVVMIIPPVASTVTLLLDAMTVILAAAETVETIVAVAEVTDITAVVMAVAMPVVTLVEMVVALVAMSQRPPGMLASHTEVEFMTTMPTIGIPVDRCGQLISSGAERPAK